MTGRYEFSITFNLINYPSMLQLPHEMQSKNLSCRLYVPVFLTLFIKVELLATNVETIRDFLVGDSND